MFGKRKEDIAGKAIMGRTWLCYTETGVYWLTKGGQFGNITGRKWVPLPGTRGAAVYKSGDINQYILSLIQ
jgi:hypothetical protein